MKKEIRNYLHLYLGCEVQTPRRVYKKSDNPVESVGKSIREIGKLMDMNLALEQGGVHFEGTHEMDLVSFPFDQLKPILRPISDMNEKESDEWIRFFYSEGEPDGGSRIPLDAIRTKWLLSKHFDLFGLIRDGLAIDATKIKED
jgi:hypothetical protein